MAPRDQSECLWDSGREETRFHGFYLIKSDLKCWEKGARVYSCLWESSLSCT